jgi:hypothetical protein
MTNTKRNQVSRTHNTNRTHQNNSPLTSRTIVISTEKDYTSDFTGKTNETDGNNRTKFITFDTKENAAIALNTLKDNEVRSKFSYYKMFFRISNMNLNNMTYNDLKDFMRTELVKLNNNLDVLRIRFNRNKDGTFTGSGDLSVDRKDDFDNLLEKKEFVLQEEIKLVLYKYNMKRDNRSKR